MIGYGPVSYTHLDVYKRQVDDVIKDDNMNYRSVTDNTKGDRTIPDHDKLYEIVENYK